jgi:2-succinyl-6-hydroxy-2,4-cyclohexadiene-1-carboxylate synthase
MRAPTLLVTGARDPKFTRIAREMAAQLPLAWVRVLDGSGHAPHLETPDAYARELLAFLETPWFEAQWLQKSSMESRT